MQVDLGDVTLDYEVVGDGDPVVLVCGAGQPAIGWRLEVAPGLNAAGFAALVFDSRGVPPSSSPPAPYSVAQLADDTLRLADHVGWDRFSVVGYSLGGWVAEELALTRPERVQAAIFVGSLNRGTAWERAITTVERDLAASDVPLPELFEAVETLRYLPNHELQDDNVVEAWLPLLAGDRWENPGRLGQYEACLAWTLDTERTNRWPLCRVPCLVVAFEHDVDSPPARAREAASELPDATYVEIAGASHLGPFTHGTALSEAVVSFLAAHRRG
ncbi:MAG: alpha/beta fold hydrolase [Actinomycetes bacterium]